MSQKNSKSRIKVSCLRLESCKEHRESSLLNLEDIVDELAEDSLVCLFEAVDVVLELFDLSVCAEKSLSKVLLGAVEVLEHLFLLALAAGIVPLLDLGPVVVE